MSLPVSGLSLDLSRFVRGLPPPLSLSRVWGWLGSRLPGSSLGRSARNFLPGPHALLDEEGGETEEGRERESGKIPQARLPQLVKLPRTRDFSSCPGLSYCLSKKA